MRSHVADVLRGLTAAAVLLAAVVHLDLYEDGFADIATVGPLFLLDFCAGVVLGVAVLVWRHWIPPLLCVGFAAATVAAYWVAVVHGLFGVKEGTSGWPEILASAAEYAGIVFGSGAVLLLLPRSVLPRPFLPRRLR
jgi:hypothetical protein